jgi:hypothetical protein
MAEATIETTTEKADKILFTVGSVAVTQNHAIGAAVGALIAILLKR